MPVVRHAIAHGLLLALSVTLAPAAAWAQDAAPPATEEPALDEARATTLRDEARAHLREGRVEQAFALLREASTLTADPTVWRELGDVCDRLRLDDLALTAYDRYLERAPAATDRAEIEGRIRVLRRIAEGHRFVPPAEGTLVDWNGRPVRMQRPRQLVSLADWDGNLRGGTPPPPAPLAPFPTARSRDGGPSLGRRLSPP